MCYGVSDLDEGGCAVPDQQSNRLQQFAEGLWKALGECVPGIVASVGGDRDLFSCIA